MVTGTWKSGLLLLMVLTAVSGCASSQAFMPAEHVTGLSPRGDQYAAEYRLEGEHGFLGEAKVWSQGAYQEEIDGNDATVVRIAFVVDNAVHAPLRLDIQRLSLEDVDLGDGTIGRISPLRVEGDPVVPAGEEREVQAIFVLPEDVWPRSVRAYSVAWAVTNGSRYAQRTPFVRVIEPRDDYFVPSFGIYYGYYSPLYGRRFSGRRGGYYDPFWPYAPRRYYAPRRR